jgi:hypothetical protein
LPYKKFLPWLGIFFAHKRLGRISPASDEDNNSWRGESRILAASLCEVQRHLGESRLPAMKDNNSRRGESRIVAASLCEAQCNCTWRRPQGGGYSNHQMFTRLSAGRTIAESSGTLNAF